MSVKMPSIEGILEHIRVLKDALSEIERRLKTGEFITRTEYEGILTVRGDGIEGINSVNFKERLLMAFFERKEP